MPSAVFYAATIPIDAAAGGPPPVPGAGDEIYVLTEDDAFYVLAEEGTFYLEMETGGGPVGGVPEAGPPLTSMGLVDEDIMVTVLVTDDAHTQPALRLSNRGPIIHQIGSATFQYQPRLLTPLQFGARISSEQYGEPVRGLPNAGAIDFAMDETLWPMLSYSWPGRTVIVARGNINNQIYKGRVETLQFQAAQPRVSMKTQSAVQDLDKPLPRPLYPDDFGIVELRGRPRPWIRGTCYSVEPVYEGLVIPPGETVASPMYRISWGANLDDIFEVRVGGVVWTRVLTYPPAPSQWFGDEPGGVFYLGGATDGGEVRCDARSVNATTWNSGAVLQEVVNLAGGVCDTDTLAQFKADAFYPIGYFVGPEQVNCLAILDEIVASVGAWWAYDHIEAVRCGLIKPPEESTFKLSEIDIEDCRLVQMIPPAWRIRIEYKRNWNPATGFFTGVTPAAQQQQSAPGLIATPYENTAVKNQDRRAVDVPIIRSLMTQESHANLVRDRLAKVEIDGTLSGAWAVRRNLYEVQCQIVAMPELYTSVGVSFQMVSGNYWIHSAVWSIGGGPSALQVWG